MSVYKEWLYFMSQEGTEPPPFPSDAFDRQRQEYLSKKRKKTYRPDRLTIKNTNEEPEKKPSDARELIQKIYNMHSDLEKQLDYIEKNMHFIPQKLRDAVADPEKILKDHAVKIQKYEKEFEEKLIEILGESVFSAEKNKKSKKMAKRGRKLQKLRATKKWIPME